MKEKAIFKKTNIIISLLLALVMMLSFCACDDEKKPEKGQTPTGTTQGETNSENTDNGDEDKNASEEDLSSTVTNNFNPLKGTFNVSENVDKAIIRADKDEIKNVEVSSNTYAPLTGYFDEEADEFRNEILNTGNTTEFYKITGTTYYVSPAGDDNGNNGTSPETPFRTMDAFDIIDLQPGDAILYERDSVYRFKRPINARTGVTYGSYGEGAKPIIYGSPENLVKKTWEPIHRINTWATTFAYEQAGNMILNNGKEIGIMKSKLTDLAANGDFFHDPTSGMVYLYCDKGNPVDVYESIEVCPGMNLFVMASGVKDVVVDNIAFKYSGAFAIRAVHPDGLAVTNCEFGYFGGFVKDGTVRYGNAIELWDTAKNIYVVNNWFYQTFDSALTWQGTTTGVYENIYFNSNLFEYNNADIEFFGPGTVENFHMDNNMMRFTSLGWGTRLNDGGVRGIEGCVRASTQTALVDTSFNNNIIDCPGREIMNWILNGDYRDLVEMKNNTIHVKKSYRTSNHVIQGYLRDLYSSPDYVTADNGTELQKYFDDIDPSNTTVWHEE